MRFDSVSSFVTAAILALHSVNSMIQKRRVDGTAIGCRDLYKWLASYPISHGTCMADECTIEEDAISANYNAKHHDDSYVFLREQCVCSCGLFDDAEDHAETCYSHLDHFEANHEIEFIGNNTFQIKCMICFPNPGENTRTDFKITFYCSPHCEPSTTISDSRTNIPITGVWMIVSDTVKVE